MNKPTVEIKEETFQVIYIRFHGDYASFRKESRSMFQELFDFASKNDLIDESFTKVLTLYHDNPYITQEKNLRTSVAMTVPVGTKIQEEGRIGVLTFSGKFAVLHFELGLRDYEAAWNYAYHEWLFVQDSVKARDAFPFELYVTEPPRNMKQKSLTDIYLPIE